MGCNETEDASMKEIARKEVVGEPRRSVIGRGP